MGRRSVLLGPRYTAPEIRSHSIGSTQLSNWEVADSPQGSVDAFAGRVSSPCRKSRPNSLLGKMADMHYRVIFRWEI